MYICNGIIIKHKSLVLFLKTTFYSVLKINDMSEGSKFNLKTLLWIALAILLMAGAYHLLNTAELPSMGDGVH
jgi:hypothetical protein